MPDGSGERLTFFQWAVLALLGLIAYERYTANADKVETNAEIGRQIERLSPMLVELVEQNKRRQDTADRQTTQMVRLTQAITVLTVLAVIAGALGAYFAFKAG